MAESNQQCSQNCSSCSSSCGSKKDPASFLEPSNQFSRIKHVVAIMSGKGGVGKSSVVSGLATAMAKRGYRVGILDGDITGPSIPQAFGLHDKASGTDRGLMPSYTDGGIAVMSLNLLLDKETDPVVWRGAMLANVIKQFWTDVIWGDLDYLFVDMPPGTGDVPLTVLQSLPVDSIVCVTSPQDLVSMIVKKAVKMATMMQKPMLGIVENYSYFTCDDCGKRHYIFGESRIEEVANEVSLPVLARIPIDPSIAEAMDKGEIEQFECNYFAEMTDALIEKMEAK